MCRSVSISLNPTETEQLFFRRREGSFEVRSIPEIRAELSERTTSLATIMEDASKKSTKAGYDAAGMVVGFISLEPALLRLQSSLGDRTTGVSLTEVEEFCREVHDLLAVKAVVSRSGGDLLLTWDSLFAKLCLEDTDFITSWDTHVRQASQGDMYSEINAHPQFEILVEGKMRLYSVREEEALSSTVVLISGKSLFFDTHNGDINDAGIYKALLSHAGFAFLSNSDSCVIPALKRFLLEHLDRDLLAGALIYLADTEARLLGKQEAATDQDGQTGQVPLRDDEFGTAREKIAHLIEIASTLKAAGACTSTIATVLAARIFEYSNKQSKFVFQSFTPLGEPPVGHLGGGIHIMLRGGSRYGGEEGGELILHLPKPYDELRRNIAVACASEENALKEQFALLSFSRQGSESLELAQDQRFDLGEIDGVHAIGYIKEGTLPVFDIAPGEVVEVDTSGRVRIFDIYEGRERTMLSSTATAWPADIAKDDAREERFAPLKVFRVEYFDSDHRPVSCPFNKYGEEIRVVQPLALRLNSEKLFVPSSDRIGLRVGSKGIGLTFSIEDDEEVRQRIRALKNIVTGGAGTSNLINTIAAAIARKLRLHKLPIISLDAFTGSDTIPSYVGGNTLFIANSNSGGTSDTMRLTHELAGLQGVLARAADEIKRRSGGLQEVREIEERLDEIRRLTAGQDLHPAGLPEPLLEWLRERAPWVYVVTNIEASGLGSIGRGLDPHIVNAAGAGVTNLPEEECVGSTFAALASLQWQIALYTYIGEIRGDISPEYAASVYTDLNRLPEITDEIVRDKKLLSEISRLADAMVGGNFDFVYTGYVDGVPEEQAHKGAEMIQEMFAGWNFFQFQHGKYAHMKRRVRHGLGSLLGHNAPPPQWHFFNARALKSPREIGPRVGNSFVIAHQSDEESFRAIPDYAPDFVFTYPADSIVLYPFQVIVVAQLISYVWGAKKKEIGQRIEEWNSHFVRTLLNVDRNTTEISQMMRKQIAQHAKIVLAEFLSLCRSTPRMDNIEIRRKDTLVALLAALADEGEGTTSTFEIETSGMLRSVPKVIRLGEIIKGEALIDDESYLALLKELAVELSTVDQARRLGDHFLLDERGSVIPCEVSFLGAGGQTRQVKEYDYLSEYEGLGTLYNVEPVHPPKIAKAKKGWL